MYNRRNLFFFHKNDPITVEKIKFHTQLAEKNGFTVVDDVQKANIILSFGGDSTFLQAVRKTGFREDCLYAGISTTDKLNFYCDFHVHDIEKIIETINRNEIQIEVRKYPTIDVQIDDHMIFQCLNEFSIRSSLINTFAMEVFIDNLHLETFRGDGMIVSTPTGSTAYNKSVQGAIVDPLLPAFQVSEIASLNNNEFRTLGSSFILSGEHVLTLKLGKNKNTHPIMGMDNEALSIQHVNNIKVKLSKKRIKTVKLKDNSFWDKVKRTFL